MRSLILLVVAAFAFAASAEIQIINGMKVECRDGVCMIVGPADEEENGGLEIQNPESKDAEQETVRELKRTKLAHGYMDADEFLAFLGAKDSANAPSGNSPAAYAILLAVLAGFLLNLTPCVLPMVPVTLMVIGRSALRGAMYAFGILCAYTLLGVLAAVFGMPFGAIQSNPWFNTAVAVLFACFALAMSGLFPIDFSAGRNVLASKRKTMVPWLFAFTAGIVGAVLAGACVAPMMFAAITQAAAYAASGRTCLAVALPAALGLGMAAPWPFVAAGMKVFPPPGAWMKTVNKLFAVLLVCFAAWYGRLAYLGFAPAHGAAPEEGGVTVDEFTLEGLEGPVLVDCWATWCKNCAAMESGTLRDGRVAKALESYRVIRLQAEDIGKLKAIPGFEDVMGLPAFAVFE